MTRRQPAGRTGMSLLEVVVTLSLAGVVLGPLYQMARLTSRAAQDARAAAAADARAEGLRAALALLVHDGRLVPALSVGPDGALREEDADGASCAWRAGDALIVRRADGYAVVERQDARLLLRRIAVDGGVQTTTIADGVRALRFGLQGQARTVVEYEVGFADGRARGALATRATPPELAPLPTPRIAPRLGAGGGR